MSDEFEPTFRRPDAKEKSEINDSVTLQGVYQRYWEARHLEKRRERQRNRRGLSVYEQAWRKHYGDYDDE